MEGNRKVLVFKGIKEISEFVNKTWADIATDSIEKREIFNIALSGGKTPQILYRNLACSKHTLPWDKTHIFLVDERFVPFDNPESNYAMIKEDLLSKINIPQENIHPIFIEKSCQASAEKYELELRRFFKLQAGEVPEFDLVMLGIGKDGHTASLFPGDRAIYEETHLACAVHLDGLNNERITLTLPVINNARNIIFLVTGNNKAKIVKEILEVKDSQLPASKIRPGHGRLFFLLDSQASSLLNLTILSLQDLSSLGGDV